MAESPAVQTDRATLASVAERAGVSRQTVSNVLHKPDIVLADTRSRVEAAIVELDYHPNLAARQMRTSRSQAVGVRIDASRDGINAVVLDRFVHALCEAAERNSYHLVVFTAAGDDQEIAAYEHLDRTLSMDGYVVVGTHAGDRRVRWLAARDRPFVAFGRPWGAAGDPEHAEHSWVDVDGAAGTEAATRHLLATGHRRIAFCGWTDSRGTGDDREAGWRRALDAATDRTDRTDPANRTDRLVLRGTDTLADGASMADRLAVEHPEVTAVVCVSDSIAIGLHQRRPHLALVGFDDTATAQVLGISSVAQPYEDAATRCFTELHRQLRSRSRAPHAQVLLTPTLQTRSAPGLPDPIPHPNPGPITGSIPSPLEHLPAEKGTT